MLHQPFLQETSFTEEFPEATEIIHGLWVGTAEAGIEATVGANSRQSLGKQENSIPSKMGPVVFEPQANPIHKAIL